MRRSLTSTPAAVVSMSEILVLTPAHLKEEDKISLISCRPTWMKTKATCHNDSVFEESRAPRE